MPSVVLVDRDGAEHTVSTLLDLQHRVFRNGMRPDSGTLAQAVATVANGQPVPAALQRLLDEFGEVGSGGQTLSQATSVYNFKAGNTRRLRSALGMARARTGTARLAFLGDSVTAGQGSTRGTNDPTAFLRQELQSRGFLAADLSHSYSGVDDPRITYEGGGFAFPWGEVTGTPGTCTGWGTVFELWTTTLAQPFTVAIDGGAPQTFTPSGANPPGIQRFAVTGLTDAQHTATITRTTGTGSVFIFDSGFRPHAGVVLHNAGMSGATVGNWLEAAAWQGATREYTAEWTLFGVASAIDPDLAVIELGLNDRWQSVSVATYRSQLGTLVDRARVKGATVALAVSNSPQGGEADSANPKWAEYVGAVYAVADDKDCPLLDLTHRWGPFDTYNRDGHPLDLAYDGAHLTAAGNAAKAQAWINLLGL